MMGFVNLGLGEGGGYSVDGAGHVVVRCFTLSPAATGILARRESDWSFTFLGKGQEFSLEVQKNVRLVGFGSV